MNTKAVIYARVSTNKQADRGTSLDTQIDGHKQYAQESGLKIVGSHNDCLSGITPMRDRPGLMAAYNDAIKHEAKLLIVWDEDRLVRDTLIYAKMRQRLDEVGIKIDFVLGGSTLSENDKIITTIKTTFASHEREQFLERTKRAKKRIASNGKVLVFDRPP